MKNLILIIKLSCLVFTSGFCQENNKEEVRIKFDTPLIVFYNNQIIDVDQYSDSSLSIGAVLHENIYKLTNQKSFLISYIDFDKYKQDILPIFFIFSQDKVILIDYKKLKCLLKDQLSNYLFKINDDSFSQDIEVLNQINQHQINKIK